MMFTRLGLGWRCPLGWGWDGDVPRAGREMSRVTVGLLELWGELWGRRGALADGGHCPQRHGGPELDVLQSLHPDPLPRQQPGEAGAGAGWQAQA